MARKKIKKPKKTIKDEEKADIKTDNYKYIEDAWNAVDYSGFLYSGTATGTTTSSATMTSTFGEDSAFYKTWDEKMKEKKHCPNCNMYFSPYLKKCPVCGTKIK